MIAVPGMNSLYLTLNDIGTIDSDVFDNTELVEVAMDANQISEFGGWTFIGSKEIYQGRQFKLKCNLSKRLRKHFISRRQWLTQRLLNLA